MGREIVPVLELLDDPELLVEKLGLQEASLRSGFEDEDELTPLVKVVLDDIRQLPSLWPDETVEVGVGFDPGEAVAEAERGDAHRR
jgi:hypothetical protein